MQNVKLKAMVLVALGALSVAGCNGGSSSGSGSKASATLTRSGVITGFGSVFVNGVEYESSAATVTTDGVPADESKLGLGMVVKLKGSVNADGKKGTAVSISYDDELEGIVQVSTIATGTVTGTLTVMGQIVNVDAATVFESKVDAITSIDQITAGNIVEVSGYTAGDGTIYATRVEVKKLAMDSGDEIELKGVISSLDDSAKTFKIGEQSIDYSTASLKDIPNGMLANDMYVEVKSTEGINSSNVLIASKVELEGDGKKGADLASGEELELEGIVTNDASLPAEFTLNDQVVLLSATTKFEHGTAADIKTGMKLEVKGTMNADHKLVAEKVEMRQESSIEIKALVDAVDAAAGTVTVLGKTIYVNTLTALEDDKDEIRYFSLNDIVAGDTVKIEAYKDVTSGDLIATQLKRESPSTSSELSGTVDSVTGFVAVIAGVNVDFTNVDPTTFDIALIVVGAQVEVSGTFASNTLTATKIKTEQHD